MTIVAIVCALLRYLVIPPVGGDHIKDLDLLGLAKEFDIAGTARGIAGPSFVNVA